MRLRSERERRAKGAMFRAAPGRELRQRPAARFGCARRIWVERTQPNCQLPLTPGVSPQSNETSAFAAVPPRGQCEFPPQEDAIHPPAAPDLWAGLGSQQRLAVPGIANGTSPVARIACDSSSRATTTNPGAKAPPHSAGKVRRFGASEPPGGQRRQAGCGLRRQAGCGLRCLAEVELSLGIAAPFAGPTHTRIYCDSANKAPLSCGPAFAASPAPPVFCEDPQAA